MGATKKKFVYNSDTLQYEAVHVKLKQTIYRYAGFFVSILFTSALMTFIVWNVWEKPRQQINNIRVSAVIEKYEQLNEIIEGFEQQVHSLEKRDNEVYRTIFQVPLPSDSMRRSGLGVQTAASRNMSPKDIFSMVEMKVASLKNRLNFQRKSYDHIYELVINKELLFAATPAIQPVSNKDLTRIASGFGYRIDPIYKTEKFHEGLDFSAPLGTPIYATADGQITRCEFNAGYGNFVLINHGYGYETLYGHMKTFNVRLGQKVKRGEVIGFVGNTGKSVGPHCHYEVIKNHVKVNPVYYFYGDLTPEQFEKIVQLTQVKNQSID